MNEAASEKLFEIMESLRLAEIFHRLQIHSDDAVCIEACVPGQIWEIDVNRDGSVQVEVFKSAGDLLEGDALSAMIEEFAEYNQPQE